MKVALIAKPWRGGLASHLLATLRASFPGQVEWIPTYPEQPRERLAYRRSPKRWRDALRARVEKSAAPVRIFVNVPPPLASLPPREGNVAWLTDDPLPQAERLGAMGRVWLSDPGYLAPMAARLADIGVPAPLAGVLPFACLPGLHAPAGQRGTRPPHRAPVACTVSSRDRKRDVHLAAALAGGAPLTVYGNHFLRSSLYWRHPARFRPPVPYRALARIYARHALSLNVHAEVVRGGTNMRTFECAACGIAQLVEARPGLEALFEPGREVILYREPEEIAPALTELLADAGRRRRLAEAARRRVLAEHTYRHRLRQMLEGLLAVP